MKSLTDYFQSCELVKAGVPKETADYYFYKDSEYSKTKKRQEPPFPYVPCWSIGALWEFLYDYRFDMVFGFDTEQPTTDVIQGLVTAACMIMKRNEDDEMER